jgi:hypothetical protein
MLVPGREDCRVDRSDGLVARMQPAADIDRGAHGKHEHDGHQREYDRDVAGVVGFPVRQLAKNREYT